MKTSLKNIMLTFIGKYKVIKYNFIAKFKTTRYIWKMSIAKRIVTDERYNYSRMERALEEMIHWYTYSKKISKIDFEREFCKKMIDMHFKRFIYYKQKMD